MTHTSHVRFLDRWVSVDHLGREDDFDVVDEVLVHNVYRVEGDHITGKVVVDVGAHVGCFSTMAVVCGAARVIAVEPNGENFDLLSFNLQRAKKDHPDCDILDFYAAASNLETVSVEGGGSTGYTVDPTDQPAHVSGFTLANVLAQAGGHIDYLKLDCEGAEYAWLDGVPPETMACVNLIRMEWHAHETARWMQDAPIGRLVEQLSYTHSVQMFGRPNAGGLLYAHAYEWPQ